jgi:hypothetical protein
MPAEEESPLDWEKPAADTNDSRASANTAPRAVRKPVRLKHALRPTRRRRWETLLTELRSREGLWWVLGGAAVGIVLLLVVLGLWALFGHGGHP